MKSITMRFFLQTKADFYTNLEPQTEKLVIMTKHTFYNVTIFRCKRKKFVENKYILHYKLVNLPNFISITKRSNK